MLPSGWEKKPIKFLCESIIDCVNKTAKTVDYVTPFKMIRTTNVRHGKVDTVTVRYVTEETYSQWIRRGAPKKGDVIFTREAPVGEAGILHDPEGVFLGQRTMMYRANPQKSDNQFLLYSLLSSYCQKQIEDLSNGGTVAHMRVPDCGEILISAPPLPEQQKIAKILSTWDKAISTTERLIDNSKQQKKALMQQLLTGKKRFAGFEGEWEEVKLGGIANYQKGYTYKSSEYSEKETNNGFLTLKSIQRGGGYSSTGIKYLLSPVDGKFAVKAGDVVFAVTDLTRNAEVVGAPIFVPELSFKNIYISMDLVKLELSELVNKQFIYYLMKHPLYRNFMRARASGSTVLHLDIQGSKKLKLLIPSLFEEQQKIAAVLTNADKEIDLLEQQLADLKQEKKALMQQLLTGKRRVQTGEDH